MNNRMKASTAAKKLAVYLPACPEEFQTATFSHEEFNQLQANPPQWLVDLRLSGPFPRTEVARKLGISVTALKKAGMDQPLTTAEIKALLADQPEWLSQARKAHAESRTAAQKD